MEMGGVEKVILGLFENLDRNKFDITLIVNLYQGELRDAVPSHIHYVKVNKGREDFSKNPLIHKIQLSIRGLKIKFLAKFPDLLDKIYLKREYDIEIASSYTDFSHVLSSSNKNSKKIGWFHTDITSKGLKPILPGLLNQITQFDYFIFGSQQANDIFKATYPAITLPENKVIINAIPIEEIKKNAEEFEIEKSKDIPVFISVGRLHNRKGYHVLAEAHKRLIDEGFPHKIMIIGDGEERDNLEKQISELQIGNSFQLLGTKMNPYPYIKNSDFYIMPSRSEGWPLIIAETLILQKPIIATNVGGISEIITHQKNGYLVEYDMESIMSGMKEFLTNKTTVANIQEGLKNSEEQFDNQKIYNSVEEILTNII
jgi:glycosyltransferase involved in cell wall biosynthesis